ncbi:DUF305 domain-containing protein [Geodermatophilus sp. YIM 151500]|uniref:DUF305 domain-containing protein n=1 Tax=Geodermatophilus sp. YIM 151500 TaxID=2984531 RepID=UPI0021E4D362|nr:DUF305 domain-containing protein [Geodermatophilus sp. YIM 151500]MCV2488748.1 DUF305 domain-containing protein [Geodermatophilus sp. YIM 151500]
MTTPPAGPAGTSSGRLRIALLAVIGVGLLLLGGGAAVALGIGRDEPPATDSVAAGFARDMAAHHLQAVEMANYVPARSSDPEVEQLAFDIAELQQNQVGRMQGWLSLWGLPFSSSDRMAWMSEDAHAGHDMSGGRTAGAMPGMASEEELAELRSLTGRALDLRFLQLMMRHHQGGFEMAAHGAEHAEVPAVRRLASTIAETQAVETTTMADMLAARGGAPLEAP